MKYPECAKCVRFDLDETECPKCVGASHFLPGYEEDDIDSDPEQLNYQEFLDFVRQEE